MTVIKGSVNTPRRLKYYFYRKTLTDIYNVLLKRKKFSRLYFQIMKRFEYLIFHKFLKWHVPIFVTNSRIFSELAGGSAYAKRIKMSKKKTSNFSEKLIKFSNNLSDFVFAKKNKSMIYSLQFLLEKFMDKRFGKLSYLNWRYYSSERRKRKRRRIKLGITKKTWFNLSRKRTYLKRANNFIFKDIAMKRISLHYGFTNINKFKKMLAAIGSASKLRLKYVLNVEGRINIILYKCNILTNNIFLINKFIRKGRVLLNGTICYNPNHVLKINDNISINPKVYKLISNILMKRFLNKKVWSCIPSYLEVNYRILFFSLITYPKIQDLLKIKNQVPFNVFDSDIMNFGVRHHIIK